MGTVAASGGYYVAAGAPLIVANPGTITGSIGVIMGFANYQQLMEKIGLVPIVVKSGDYKDVGSPVRPMEEKERAFLEAFVGKIHRQFIRDVAEGREMEIAMVEELADGRIFTGQESKELGLVDRLGNLADAVEWAGRLGGIQGEITTVYARERRISLLELLRSEASLWMRQWVGWFQPNLRSEFRYRPAAP
jgi:protease-4